MIAHLKGREKAIEELGFKPAEAEWIALVALHSGIFLRSQYGRFLGENGATGRKRAERLAANLVGRGLAVDSAISDMGRACHLTSRAVYRALGAEHIRHRRTASLDTLLRRLLSLDCVLGELASPWLPTEQEKVAAFESLGIERRVLPKRVYGFRGGGRTVRSFGWKMPVAFGKGGARFVYVDTGGETQDEMLSWGAEHTSLWSALVAGGVRVEAVAVALDPGRVVELERVLARWKERGIKGPGTGIGDVEIAELKVAEQALAALDEAAMARWGGLQGTIDRVAELQRRRDATSQESAGSVCLDVVQARAAKLRSAGVLGC